MSQFKSLLIENKSETNNIEISLLSKAKGNIKIDGVKNSLVFGKDTIFSGNIRIEGNNNKIIVEEGCAIRGQILVKGEGQSVTIGKKTTFQSVYILCQEDCDVTIGKYCMFSREIEIRTTDAHSVVDLTSLNRINKAKSIHIGDHVWVGVRALISKGSFVPSDNVVGANSFVNSHIGDSNCIIAGSPAKIVKRNISWHRSRRESFTLDELNFWQED